MCTTAIPSALILQWENRNGVMALYSTLRNDKGSGIWNYKSNFVQWAISKYMRIIRYVLWNSLVVCMCEKCKPHWHALMYTRRRQKTLQMDGLEQKHCICYEPSKCKPGSTMQCKWYDIMKIKGTTFFYDISKSLRLVYCQSKYSGLICK